MLILNDNPCSISGAAVEKAWAAEKTGCSLHAIVCRRRFGMTVRWGHNG